MAFVISHSVSAHRRLEFSSNHLQKGSADHDPGATYCLPAMILSVICFPSYSKRTFQLRTSLPQGRLKLHTAQARFQIASRINRARGAILALSRCLTRIPPGSEAGECSCCDRFLHGLKRSSSLCDGNCPASQLQV